MKILLIGEIRDGESVATVTMLGRSEFCTPSIIVCEMPLIGDLPNA
jgi:hypothetical protein